MTDKSNQARRPAGRRVLVTGASGFIGAPLCRRLAELGSDVLATSRTRLPEGEGLEWHSCDLADFDATKALFQRARPEFVIHLASRVVGARTPKAVLPTFHSNLTSTVNVLLAAQQAGCERTVLAGSLEEPEPGPTWPVPSSPYAAAKLAANAYGRMFNALFGLPLVILRVFMVYGPAQRDESKLLPYVIKSLLNGQKPRMSSGLREVDWIYVDDVVRAFVRAAFAPGVEGVTLDIGSGKLVTVRQVVERVFQVLRPGEPPEFGHIPDRPMEQTRVADLGATRRQIGWSPRVSLAEGLSRTIDWYRRRVFEAWLIIATLASL
jgi:UDP-glucose 4-epimerase